MMCNLFVCGECQRLLDHAGGRLLDLPERGEKGGEEEKKEEKGEGKKGRKGRPLTSPLSI